MFVMFALTVMTKMFLHSHRSIALQELFLISDNFINYLNYENGAWVKSSSEEQVISTHLYFQKATVFSFMLVPFWNKIDLYLTTITVS